MRTGHMTFVNGELARMIPALEDSAHEIDQTFAEAGGQLGAGLSLFEDLKLRLSTLSTDLDSPAVGQASATMATLARDLHVVGAGLSRELQALTALTSHSHVASQTLNALLDDMRLITILARSARIEGVSAGVANSDFGDFTTEIVRLTSQAWATIQRCAHDHEHLIKLLHAALGAQRDFQQQYGGALAALTANLEQKLVEVVERQRRSIGLTTDAAAHSGRIALAAGQAIIALQSGDSIRQRLEHAIAALHVLETVAHGTGESAGFTPAERDAGLIVLRNLEAAQLDACAVLLRDDAQAIRQALTLLATDTGGLLDLVRSLYSDNEGDSFLAGLETDLAAAAALLEKCNRARAGIDDVTRTLTGVLETCQQTVAGLVGTVASIVMIGMNAGLRAARFGTSGRSLVVIAQELKLAADTVAQDAARLTPVFALMQQAADGLTPDGRLDADHFAKMSHAMREALATMSATSTRLNTTLGLLTKEGGAFGHILANASRAFSSAGATSQMIVEAAATLGREAADARVAPASAAPVAALLRTHIYPRYTMAAERDIHLAVLSALGAAEQRMAS